jgi:small subunit ribosomal protein S11
MGRTRIKLVQGEEAEEKKEEKKEERKRKAKKKIFVDLGIFYINSHFNNTLISFTDKNGNVLAWSSCGYVGFKNTKKATPYAGAKAMEALLEKVNKNFDIKEAKVIVKGIGPGRESALRVLFNSNLNIIGIEDRTPIPFGGPTPPKPKRM